MLMAMMAGIAGTLVPQLAGWVAWPAHLLLGYMVGMVQTLASWPRASVNQSLSLTGMLAMYGLLGGVMFILWRKNDKITGKNQENLAGEI
jgi:hypothetical protein